MVGRGKIGRKAEEEAHKGYPRHGSFGTSPLACDVLGNPPSGKLLPFCPLLKKNKLPRFRKEREAEEMGPGEVANRGPTNAAARSIRCSRNQINSRPFLGGMAVAVVLLWLW